MSLSGFRLQSDWQNAFRKEDKTVWFHKYDASELGLKEQSCCPFYVNNDLLNLDTTESLKLVNTHGIYLPQNVEYECELLHPSVLSLTSKKDGLKSYFQAPSTSTNLIDCKSSGRISCVDVSPNGELLLYATTDQSMVLREAVSGDVRREFEGHLGEIYKCRFFPSSLAAITAGSDMQLKIWCLVTGRCAAVLAPRCAGAIRDTHQEPGGHRSAVLDCGIIERGRNIVSIDRCGWLRLWDVSSQTCLSAIPVTERALSAVDSYLILEEITCLTVKKYTQNGPSPFGSDQGPEHWYNVLETSSTTAKEVGTTDTLVAVGCGQNAMVKLFELNQRSRGCVAKIQLPNPTGAVETVAFCEDLHGDRCPYTSHLTGAFSSYGLFAGGQNDELAVWDIRHTKEPLWQLLGERGAVHHIRAIESPSYAAIWLFVCRSDGRAVVYSFDPATASVHVNHELATLDMTGIDCEPIRGLGLAPLSSNKLSAWIVSRSGLMNFYNMLYTEKIAPFDIRLR